MCFERSRVGGLGWEGGWGGVVLNTMTNAGIS